MRVNISENCYISSIFINPMLYGARLHPNLTMMLCYVMTRALSLTP